MTSTQVLDVRTVFRPPLGVLVKGGLPAAVEGQVPHHEHPREAPDPDGFQLLAVQSGITDQLVSVTWCDTTRWMLCGFVLIPSNIQLLGISTNPCCYSG